MSSGNSTVHSNRNCALNSEFQTHMGPPKISWSSARQKVRPSLLSPASSYWTYCWHRVCKLPSSTASPSPARLSRPCTALSQSDCEPVDNAWAVACLDCCQLVHIPTRWWRRRGRDSVFKTESRGGRSRPTLTRPLFLRNSSPAATPDTGH